MNVVFVEASSTAKERDIMLLLAIRVDDRDAKVRCLVYCTDQMYHVALIVRIFKENGYIFGKSNPTFLFLSFLMGSAVKKRIFSL